MLYYLLMFNCFFLLLCAHFLADFALQNNATAINKNRNAKTALQQSVPWFWWMLSHSFIHGGLVFLITHNIFAAIAEIVFHFVIDFFKCEKKYNIHIDQFLHILCKIAWVLMFVN